MDELKLFALDQEDIAVVSTHLQDARVKVADILWRPQEQRLVVVLDRFDWVAAAGREARPAALPRGAALRARAAPAAAATSTGTTRTRRSICWRSNSPSRMRRPAS